MRPGAYDQLITVELANELRSLPAERVLREALDSELGPEVLARHLYFIIRRMLMTLKENQDPQIRLQVSNQIIDAISTIRGNLLESDQRVEATSKPILIGVTADESVINGLHEINSPEVPLSQSALLVNGKGQPKIGTELQKEFLTADNVDFIVSFLKDSGLNVVEKGLKSVIGRGGNVRVLTTTYMGASQKSAVDRLVELGAQVKISYDSTKTRLHAKSWIIKRESGATTAYVGSSNLSLAALQDGVEWNLRISNREQPHIISVLETMFEETWNDIEFELYDPIKDGEKFAAALESSASWGRGESGSLEQFFINFAGIEVEPRPFQQEVLDQLEAERILFDRHSNLVVMATGTGKTVVAGLDYRRLHDQNQVKTLLFIAHRKEILRQSQSLFRAVMREGDFGELLVDGERPTHWNHVFASVQSLSQKDIHSIDPTQFDMVIIDEFHHAGAETYEALLGHLKPKILLGLTATPERTDEKDILKWFGGHVAAELRLWDAIDRQILSPFQYFGLHDNVDLRSSVPWKRGFGYEISELSNVYTGNDMRVALVLQQIKKHVSDISNMKAIGFCVSIAHANFMAEKFCRAGIQSVAVTSDMTTVEREDSLKDLKIGKIKAIFAVDIFNEGVDIPDVNTLLMLRPTESATIFIQQLGRGLRKTAKKDCLIVLDFVGNQNANFRFDFKYGKLLGLSNVRLKDALESGYPTLPMGCHFELDTVTKEQVLSSLRNVLGATRNSAVIANFRDIKPDSLIDFVSQSGLSLEQIYKNGRSFTILQKLAFEPDQKLSESETSLSRAFSRCLHIDDEARLSAYSRILNDQTLETDKRYLKMFGYLIFNKQSNETDPADLFRSLRRTAMNNELLDLLDLLKNRRARITLPLNKDIVPLEIHARYSRAEILAAFDCDATGAEFGVKWVEDQGADLAFVTLNKNEKHFSPTTMYADTAISTELFQWESQSQTSETSETGKRYQKKNGSGSTFHLFVREHKNDPETGTNMPFMYFGPANYVSHVGSSPMRILWRLDYPIPTDVLSNSKVLAS